MIIDRKIAAVRSAKSKHKNPADSSTNVETSPDDNITVKDKLTEETVYMYGDIGGYFGIDHLEFVKDFNDTVADVIHLRIDSQGGDVFAARAMKTAIMQHKAKVIAHIDGIAASAASFVAMGADEIEMVDGGFIMIHNATSFMDIFGYFNVEELKRLQDTIDKETEMHVKINEAIASDYVKRTGKDLDDVLDLMSAETWFDAAEALENNFIDRVYDGDPLDASYDLSIFAKVPDLLQSRNQDASKRTIENALRDVGLSATEAKAVLAGAFSDKQRDVVDTEDTDTEPAVIDGQRDVDEETPKDRIAKLLEDRDDKEKITDLLTRTA